MDHVPPFVEAANDGTKCHLPHLPSSGLELVTGLAPEETGHPQWDMWLPLAVLIGNKWETHRTMPYLKSNPFMKYSLCKVVHSTRVGLAGI